MDKIVISEKFYAGFQPRAGLNSDIVQLGFITYFEDNAAFKKRKATIDSWASKVHHCFKDTQRRDFETIDNVPTSGFQLSRSVTHGGGWNDTTTYWRVLDPRGFEIEISSGNLAKLFQFCDIEKGGIIKQDCVYGWDKNNQSKVVLLPVNSDIYVAAQQTTALHNSKSVSKSKVYPNCRVKLKSGQEGVYVGERYFVGVDLAHTFKRDVDGSCVDGVKSFCEKAHVFVLQKGDSLSLFISKSLTNVIEIQDNVQAPFSNEWLSANLVSKTSKLSRQVSTKSIRHLAYRAIAVFDSEPSVAMEFKTMRERAGQAYSLDDNGQQFLAVYYRSRNYSAGDEKYTLYALSERIPVDTPFTEQYFAHEKSRGWWTSHTMSKEINDAKYKQHVDAGEVSYLYIKVNDTYYPVPTR